MPLFLFRGGDKQDVGAARSRSWGFRDRAFGIGQGTPTALQYFQNNCLALKIFFHALKNFFQALKKNFQALEKIFQAWRFVLKRISCFQTAICVSQKPLAKPWRALKIGRSLCFQPRRYGNLNQTRTDAGLASMPCELPYRTLSGSAGCSSPHPDPKCERTKEAAP